MRIWHVRRTSCSRLSIRATKKSRTASDLEAIIPAKAGMMNRYSPSNATVPAPASLSLLFNRCSMTPTLRRKLQALAERRDELERLLADPATIADNDRFRSFSREFSQLEPLAIALASERRARED